MDLGYLTSLSNRPCLFATMNLSRGLLHRIVCLLILLHLFLLCMCPSYGYFTSLVYPTWIVKGKLCSHTVWLAYTILLLISFSSRWKLRLIRLIIAGLHLIAFEITIPILMLWFIKASVRCGACRSNILKKILLPLSCASRQFVLVDVDVGHLLRSSCILGRLGQMLLLSCAAVFELIDISGACFARLANQLVGGFDVVLLLKSLRILLLGIHLRFLMRQMLGNVFVRLGACEQLVLMR